MHVFKMKNRGVLTAGETGEEIIPPIVEIFFWSILTLIFKNFQKNRGTPQFFRLRDIPDEKLNSSICVDNNIINWLIII